MSHFTQSSAVRAALVAATVALFASHAAYSAQPKEISYWAQAQTASRAAPQTPQFASRAGDASDKGVSAQYASRATDTHDHGGYDRTASRAGDRQDGSQVASRAGDRTEGANADA